MTCLNPQDFFSTDLSGSVRMLFEFVVQDNRAFSRILWFGDFVISVGSVLYNIVITSLEVLIVLLAIY